MILAAALLAAGCRRSQPTYDLIIGDTTVALPVHADPTRIQDDLIARVKPLWEDLTAGESATFYYQRVAPYDIGDDLTKRAREKYGPRVTFTFTQTTTSARRRFFKNRDGTNGLELVGEEQKLFPLISGPAVEWADIEWHLRDQEFTLEFIRCLIQNDLSDQGAGATP